VRRIVGQANSNVRFPADTMSDRPHSLLSAPPSFPDESPASWIQRVCQAHAVTYRDLLSHLGIPHVTDPDVRLPVEHLGHIGRGTNVPEQQLQLLSQTFSSSEPALLRRNRLQNLLCFDNNGQAMYRYCPRCLLMPPAPYLRVAWRFVDWVWCPTHRTAMLDYCCRCHARLLSVQPSLRLPPDGVYPDISICRRCGESLSSAKALRDEGNILINFRPRMFRYLVGYFHTTPPPYQLDVKSLLGRREHPEWYDDMYLPDLIELPTLYGHK
jgi:hypothetical protein